MTHNQPVQRSLAATPLALTALSLATLVVVADPATENDGRLTEGSAANTLPGGEERQAK
ncbi:MAG: hypothetical protein ACOC26_00565 [Halochromatium sp.]